MVQHVTLLDTSGNKVKTITVNNTSYVRVSVPIGLTAQYSSSDYSEPKLYVNGVEKAAASLPPQAYDFGFIPTEHPRVGDIVVFEHS